MKVLVSGWEFAPHISGGLGTACFGLTESLAKENTQIIFVIPKTDNETIEEGLQIRSASPVEIPIHSIAKHTIQHSYKCGDREVTKSASKLEVISVTAALTPDTSPHLLSDVTSISNWNHRFSEPSIVPSFDLNTNKLKEQATIRYPFSGGYGPNGFQQPNDFYKNSPRVSDEEVNSFLDLG